MKILIPTDYSKLSEIAIQYAIGLSKDFDLDIVLLHVASSSTTTTARIGSKKMIEAIKASTKLGMKRLLETIKEENSSNLKISSEIIYTSSITTGIENFAIKNNIDVICIGTKGATGIKKVLFGSNAAKIISNSSIPVLTIPEHVKYEGINNMVYSCDLENTEKELNVLVPFAKLLDAWVHILHINKRPESHADNLQSQENGLKTSISYQKIKTKELQNDSIVKGINEYVVDIDADLVVMFTRNTSLFEKLFNKSATQEEAFQTKTPLLSFQKE